MRRTVLKHGSMEVAHINQGLLSSTEIKEDLVFLCKALGVRHLVPSVQQRIDIGKLIFFRHS